MMATTTSGASDRQKLPLTKKRSKFRDEVQFSDTEDESDDRQRLARRNSMIIAPIVTAKSQAQKAKFDDHYGSCVRLAAENKITSKNAFNLHLIDFMTDFVKKGEFVNFQIASSTLDAGAKIYAGRVDAVHQETYQVLIGLGRSDGKQKNANNPNRTDDDGDGDDLDDPDDNMSGGVVPDAKQRQQNRDDARKRNQMRKNIIAKRLTKLRNRVELSKGDIDPLFQHQAAAFDDGGTRQLRLNQARVISASCELFLDSNTSAFNSYRKNETQYSLSSQPVPLPFSQDKLLSSVFASAAFSSVHGFQLTQMDDSLFLTGQDENSDRQSMSSPPPPFEANLSDDYDFDDGQDDFRQMEEEREEIIDLPPIIPIGLAANELSIECLDFVSGLKSMISDKIEVFGLEHSDLLGLWAGPDHWKKKAARRALTKLSAECGRQRPTKRAKQEVFVYNNLNDQSDSENRTRSGKLYRVDWNQNDLRVVSEKKLDSLILSLKTREKNQAICNSMPCEYLKEQFFISELSEAPISIIGLRRRSQQQGEKKEDDIPHDYDDDGVGMEEFVPDECHNVYTDYDDDSGEFVQNDFGQVFTQATTAGGDADQMELLSQPRKIAKIEINYAKIAKNINARKLKNSMWTILSELPEEQREENTAASDGCTLSRLLQEVPPTLDKDTASQLSVPIMLNCLLHLANEKKLFISSREDFRDLDISRSVCREALGQLQTFIQSTSLPQRRRQTLLDDYIDTSLV